MPIKIGQKWVNKRSPNYQVLITQKRGDKWNAKTLTEKSTEFGGTHKLASRTLWTKFKLV